MQYTISGEENNMKKVFFLVIFLSFYGMTIFAQLSFGEVLFRDSDGIHLISYGFTNTYEDVNIFTLQEINGRMPRTLDWTLINDVMADELKNEMNRRNVNFAFRMVDHEGRYLFYIWRRVEGDFFYSEVIW